MSKQITITLPDGYEDANYLVVVGVERGTPVYRPSAGVEWSAAVVEIQKSEGFNGALIEEVGCAPLGKLMTEAGQYIRAYEKKLRSW